MKKINTMPLFIILTALMMSFTGISDYRIEKKTAEVQQVDGLYIFFCAEPVMEYKYLGTAKVRITGTDDTDSRIHAATKKAKKEYPYCDAIIFRELDLGSCDCVKFAD